VYTIFWPSRGTFSWLPIKWCHFRVTSGPLRSHDVIFCHVTAYFCELQHCRKWNVERTWVFGLVQPLPGDFRSNDVTSESLSVTIGHLASFFVTWLPAASYGLVGSEIHRVREFLAFSHFQVSSGQMMSLPGQFRSSNVTHVISCHVTATSCELQPCRKWNVQCTAKFWPSTATSRWLPANDVTSMSLPVTWGHVTSFPVAWLPFPASYSLVGSEM